MPKFADPDTEAPDRESGLKFFKMEDLIGRNVIIVPKSIEWKQGDRDKYESITADVIVLDGRRTEKIPALPHVERNKFLGGWALVAELRKYVPGSGDKEAGKPVIGVLIMDGKSYKLDTADKNVLSDPATMTAWNDYQANGEPPF